MTKTSKSSGKKGKKPKETALHPAAQNIIESLRGDGWKIISIYDEVPEEEEG